MTEEEKSWLDSCGSKKCKKDALQPELAIGGLEPFAQGMSGVAAASGTGGDGRDALRKGNVGVGGRAFEARTDAEVAVHVANCREQGGVGSDFASGSRPDDAEGRFQRWVVGTISRAAGCRALARSGQFLVQARLHGLAQGGLQAVDLRFGLRAEVHLDRGAEGDGVD